MAKAGEVKKRNNKKNFKPTEKENLPAVSNLTLYLSIANLRSLIKGAMAAKKKYASIPYVNGYLCTNVLADCYPPDTTTDFCVVGSIPAKNISVEYSIVTLAQLNTIIWENQNLLNKN